MKKVFLLAVTTIIFSKAFSQQVTIAEDPNVTKVMDWYKQLKSSENTIEGWAVQIISTRDRRKMEEARQSFRFRYPQYQIENDYVEPLYRLRVGKFINKLDAMAVRTELRSRYRSALLIKQEFNKSEFY